MTVPSWQRPRKPWSRYSGTVDFAVGLRSVAARPFIPSAFSCRAFRRWGWGYFPLPPESLGGRLATLKAAAACSCAPPASPATSRTAAGRASSSCGCTIAMSPLSRRRFARGSNPPRRRAHASDLAREIRHQQADERYVITSQNVLAGPQTRIGEPPIRRVKRRRLRCARRCHRRRPHHEGARGTGGLAVDVDARLWTS